MNVCTWVCKLVYVRFPMVVSLKKYIGTVLYVRCHNCPKTICYSDITLFELKKQHVVYSIRRMTSGVYSNDILFVMMMLFTANEMYNTGKLHHLLVWISGWNGVEADESHILSARKLST